MPSAKWRNQVQIGTHLCHSNGDPNGDRADNKNKATLATCHRFVPGGLRHDSLSPELAWVCLDPRICEPLNFTRVPLCKYITDQQ